MANDSELKSHGTELADCGAHEGADRAADASTQRERCSSCSFNAASPLGRVVRPCSMSLTEEGASPISAPISANVIPFLRRSEMREAQVSIVRGSLRPTVETSQRSFVTEFRKNADMARPADLPHFASIGERVKYWRAKRGIKRPELAKRVGLAPSTLADLENGYTDTTRKLHLIAAELRLNPHYLESDRGDPEAPAAPAPQIREDWPLQRIGRAELEALDPIERSHVEVRLREALEEIEAARRARQKAG